MLPFLALLLRIYRFVMHLVNRFLRSDNDAARTGRTSLAKRDRDSRRSKDLEDIINGQVEEIQAWKKRDRASQDIIKGLQEDLQASQAAHQASEERCHELDDYGQRMKKYAAQLERNGKATEGEKAELERALAQAQAERRDLTTLLDRRTAELKEAQTYLNKVDDVADSEVLALVQRINTQIFQTAAKISDDFLASYGTQKYSAIVKEAVARLEKSTTIGAELPLILSTSNHSADPILVQIALQVALATLAYHAASPWSTSFEKQTAFLHSIYAEMCKHELQSVFGRWRTMTLTYARALIPEKAQGASMPTSRMIDCVSDVLLACGADGSPEQVRDLVKQHYGKRLKQLATHVLDFRRIAGEQIVSRDLQVIVAWPPAPFDPTLMEDEWAETKKSASPASASAVGNILCTTHLGLIRQERRAEADKDSQDAEPMRKVVMLKPKVVLHSTLRELLPEPEPETGIDEEQRSRFSKHLVEMETIAGLRRLHLHQHEQ
ncbi:hypothetical protein TRAPUB_6861 [Trametes pubescens]|uniref:Uncharacterized protein n=1 Tax=Trametes pubescens TaxID=154538 RepID=A0A1M2V4Y5_TRAPU|nr:hypothetical protein TRAPUB_6861 [Trametes pubescens]